MSVPPAASRLGRGIRLLLPSPSRTPADVYTLLAADAFLGERSRYLNLGWWEEATATFDDASDALAEQLGHLAQIREGDSVLDVGFGFGDQDEYWLRRFGPARILGLNVTPLQVEAARRRFRDPRLEFRVGSATAIDLPAASVDRVTALECAFHFSTRADFFAEAFRVLLPGGRLAAADIVARAGRWGQVARLFAWALRGFWRIPRENWYGIDAYRRALEDAGFVDVDVRSVRNRVVVPFWEACRRAVRGHTGIARRSALFRAAARVPLGAFDAIDYVLASARRPSASSA